MRATRWIQRLFFLSIGLIGGGSLLVFFLYRQEILPTGNAGSDVSVEKKLSFLITHPNRLDLPLIFAHRGDHFLTRSNSLEAVERALVRGYDGVELDVSTTVDGRLILSHDENLNFQGKEIEIHENSYAVLKKMFPEMDPLEEVLDRFGGKLLFILEIKSDLGSNVRSVDHFCDLVRKKRIQSSVIISSLDYPVIQKLQSDCPDLHSMFEMSGPIDLYSKLLDKFYRSPFISVGTTSITPEFLAWTDRKKKILSVYTPNTIPDMNAMIQKKIPMVQTDFPGTMKALREASHP